LGRCSPICTGHPGVPTGGLYFFIISSRPRFVIAPVSPAVVVPRLLELREAGYGVEKGISTFIIAAACLDNVLAISLFGVTLNFVFPEGSLAFTIIQGPLQVVLGLTFGLLWGGCLGFLFSQDQVVVQISPDPTPCFHSLSLPTSNSALFLNRKTKM